MVDRAQIVVKGIVQGVGFRPYVFNLAESLQLKGYVTNTAEGVLIEVEGLCLPDFIRRLRNEAPPLSRISDISVTNLPAFGYHDFSIRKSIEAAARLPFTLVSPDVSICGDCLREMLDPADRRYLYPFINCTNCGPRYSITRSVPYDRPNTTMAGFAMCPECLSEYEDPRNRRFHAQPNACPKCGPAVEFKVRSSEPGMRGPDAIAATIHLLKEGGIVAVKGLGGFHIACDATNDAAVRRLRERKRKSNKPFAVMAPSIEAAGQFCDISDRESEVLGSNRRPVVLLVKKGAGLSEAVSPHNRFVGAMLPYTPLHYLLFHHPLGPESRVQSPGSGRRSLCSIAGKTHFTALVMTSGNLSEEPIVRDNDEAMRKLESIVDGFLLHNRDIFMRVDDSVVRVRNAECGAGHERRTTNNSELSFIRRSRGYAPDPVALDEEGPEVLGCGADLKNTFTLTKGAFAIPGQHIGDMENYETIRFFEESLANIKAVYRADPKIIVHDLHPGYLSTRRAAEQAAEDRDLALYGIQHHYAHIGSVMAEYGLTEKVIGVAFDGTGYGTDGRLWGGEFLIADVEGFERAAQLKYVPLPGGETAIREPWRTAVSIIMLAVGDRAGDCLEAIGFVDQYGKETLQRVMRVASSPELSPLSSGAGRLFDSFSALLGVCDRNTFEGEAAMALEALTTDGIEEEYPAAVSVENGRSIADFSPAVHELISDMKKNLPRNVIATRFHNTVAAVIRRIVLELSSRYGIAHAALSGGTFQNLYLLNRTVRMLEDAGIQVFVNREVPCNDGGISLGQAYLVRERLKKFRMRNAECGI